MNPRHTGPACYEFGPYRFQTCPFELLRHGETLPLQQQAARLLELFLHRAGDSISRTEIRNWLWDPETHVDFDQAINFLVRTLRRTLADDAKRPTFIETIPRVGYRFVAPVTARRPRRGSAQARLRRIAVGVGVLTIGILLVALPAHVAPRPSRGALGVSTAEADDLMLRGRFLLQSDDAEKVEQAMSLLEEALALSGDPVPAALELCTASVRLRRWREAERWARLVLQHQPTSATAFTTLARAATFFHRDLATAELHYRAALEAQPASTRPRIEYSAVLSALGRHEEAVDVALEAVDLDPVAPETIRNLARRYFHARRFGEAVDEAKKLLELSNRTGAAHSLIIDSLLLLGRREAALAQMNAYLTEWGWEPFVEPGVYWQRVISYARWLDPAGWAWTHLQAGDRQKARKALREAACGGEVSPAHLMHLAVDPRLDAFRGEPWFPAVLACASSPPSAPSSRSLG